MRTQHNAPSRSEGEGRNPCSHCDSRRIVATPRDCSFRTARETKQRFRQPLLVSRCESCWSQFGYGTGEHDYSPIEGDLGKPFRVVLDRHPHRLLRWSLRQSRPKILEATVVTVLDPAFRLRPSVTRYRVCECDRKTSEDRVSRDRDGIRWERGCRP